MNGVSLSHIAIRILALYMIGEGFAFLIGSLLYPGMEGDIALVFVYAAPFIVGGLLWFLAPAIAYLLVPVARRDAEVVLTNANVIQTVVVVFGIYLVVTAIPNIVYFFIWFTQEESLMVEGESVSERIARAMNDDVWLAQIARELTKLILGMIFLVGPSGISNGLERLKNFGLGEAK